jgi:hypothetical protein
MIHSETLTEADSLPADDKIVTVAVDFTDKEPARAVLKKHSLPGTAWAQRKTALAPPAVRAPVFPHALPVTEGLKATISKQGKGIPPALKICLEICPRRLPVLSQPCLQFVKSRELRLAASADFRNPALWIWLISYLFPDLCSLIQTICAGCFTSEPFCWLFR